jgi:hypothetical protein
VFNEATHSHFLLSQPGLPDFSCRRDCQLRATSAVTACIGNHSRYLW